MNTIMKLSPVLLAVILMLWSGCTSTNKSKTAIPDYIGQWDYVLAGPEGDIKGFLIFKQENGQTIGVLGGDQGEATFSNLSISEEKVTGNFNYMGYSVYMDGLFEGNILKGKMSAEGYEFPFEATKQQ